MYCTRCGKELSDDVEFCTGCGAKVKGDNMQESPRSSVANEESKAEKAAEEKGSEKKPGGKKKAVISVIAGVTVIAGVALAFVFGSERKAEMTIAHGSENSGEASETGANRIESDTAMLSLNFREAINNAGLGGVRVAFRGGYDNTDGEVIAEAVALEDGTVQVELEAGDYTISWQADGYYSGSRNMNVQGTDNRVEHLLPVLSDNRAYVLIEWNSDKDLDLCVYNAQTNQYISIKKAADDMGNFLYGDNGGAEGYELICLGDCTVGMYTVFVRDNASLTQGTDSTMGADGLSVSIYTANGLLYHNNADTAENAALWSPVYLQDGESLRVCTGSDLEGAAQSYVSPQGGELWLINDDAKAQLQILDRQYYASYARPDTLSLTDEQIERLSHMACSISQNLSWYGEESSDGYYTIWNIQEILCREMSDFLFETYYGENEYLGEDEMNAYYQVDATVVQRMLKELFGLEYDLTVLTTTDREWGAYYSNGNIVTYESQGIGSGSWPDYNGMYLHDGLWVFQIEICYDYRDGLARLYLRPANNSYGCEVTGCDCIWYSIN